MHQQLNSDSNNKTIAAHIGDTVEIVLDETLTAGYEWAIENMTEDILQLQSSDYKPGDAGAIGGSGLRKMVFAIIKPGKGRIKLKNWQRWSGDIYKNFEVGIQAE